MKIPYSPGSENVRKRHYNTPMRELPEGLVEEVEAGED